MKSYKQFGAMLGGLILAVGLLVTTGNAGVGTPNQITRFTFSQPVEVPGRILPAGTYWFQLLGDNTTAERNEILIYNSDRTQLITSVQSIPADHVTDVYETEVKLTQPSDGSPAAMLDWFYPYDSIGHEFYYSPTERDRLLEQQPFTAKAELSTSHGVILSASLH